MEEKPKISDEMQMMEYEPLLPIEKKLIIYSISLGVLLLAVLVILSRTLFPVVK